MLLLENKQKISPLSPLLLQRTNTVTCLTRESEDFSKFWIH